MALVTRSTPVWSWLQGTRCRDVGSWPFSVSILLGFRPKCGSAAPDARFAPPPTLRCISSSLRLFLGLKGRERLVQAVGQAGPLGTETGSRRGPGLVRTATLAPGPPVQRKFGVRFPSGPDWVGTEALSPKALSGTGSGLYKGEGQAGSGGHGAQPPPPSSSGLDTLMLDGQSENSSGACPLLHFP